MMFPDSGKNALLQLNMGEGKSSVIVPLVSSALADGKQLVRIVVLKPLAQQMFNLLSRRLCGLANRRIFYLPFSREIDALTASKELQPLFETCLQERGILLAQPEHLLSLKLMAIDMAIRTEERFSVIAKTLLDSQSWLIQKSRDILDESDEILNVKYQLVYTSGLQEPVDDHPDRWIRIQKILQIAERQAYELQKIYPDAVIVDHAAEKHIFPIVRIIDPVAATHLNERIAKKYLAGDYFRLMPSDVRQAAVQFVTTSHSQETDISLLSHYKGTTVWRSILLLRGFLGSGILLFILSKKRWRVDYGLDLTRSLLAVPYRAKDVPTIRADFGHPDVAIAFTCLSYYYGGLRNEDLTLCFTLLFKLDNPVLEYEVRQQFI